MRHRKKLDNYRFFKAIAIMICFFSILSDCAMEAVQDVFENFYDNCDEIEKEINSSTNPSKLARLYFILGKCYEKLDKKQKAYIAFITAYESSSLALTPDELLHIARAAENFDQEGKAIEILEAMLKIYPKYRPALDLINRLDAKIIAKLKKRQKLLDEQFYQCPLPPEVPPPPDCKTILAQIQAVEWVQKKDKLPPLYRDLGKCYIANQKEKEAEAAYEKALSYNYQFPMTDAVEMAIYLGDSGKEDLAIKALQEVLKGPSPPQNGLISLAKFLNWKGGDKDQKEAEKWIEQALKKEPGNVDALLIKGAILNATKRSKEAISLFTQLLAGKLEEDQKFTAHIGIARGYLNLKEYVAAENTLAKLEAKYPYQQKDIDTLTNELQQQKDDKTRKQEEVQAHIDSAASLTEKRCFEAAYWEIYQALKKDPCNIEARIALANALTNDGRFCEAKKALDFVFINKPEKVEAWISYGNLLLAWGDIPGSDLAFQEALYLDPSSFDALISYAYTDLGWDNRMGAYRKMLSLFPKEEEQCQELSDMLWYMVLGPVAYFDYIHFKDCDDIVTDDFLLDLGGYYKDWRLDLFYHHVIATQPVDNESQIREEVDALRAEGIWLASPRFDLAGGIGIAQIHGMGRGNFGTGVVRANVRSHLGTFSAGSVYDLYTWTASALFFRIRQWRNYFSYSKVFSGRWSGGFDYEYSLYSDANHYNKVDLFAQYQLWAGPCWNVYLNYNTTYWNYKSQILSPFVLPGVLGGHGYFDPQNYYENQVGVTCILDTKRFYFYFHPFGAYITYNQSGIHNGFYVVAKGDATYKFTNKHSVGISLEGGLYPLKNVFYNYSQLSAHLRLAY